MARRLCVTLLVLALAVTIWLRASAAEDTRRDYSILIRGHRVVPSPGVSSDSTETHGEAIPRIVQFDGPLTREQRDLLEGRFGLCLEESIPHYAFLERLDSAQVEALRELDFFRWSGPYESRFKIDPMIGRHAFQTEERRSETGILLMVVLFSGSNLEALAERVRGLGFEVVSITDEPNLTIQRLQVRVGAPSDARVLAELPAVKSIEEVGEVTLNEELSERLFNGAVGPP